MIAYAPYYDAVLPKDVQVVKIDFDFAITLSDSLFDVLSDEERRTAARFHRAADAIRSAATRSVLRRELAAVLGKAPERLRFLRSDRGRPALDTGDVVSRLDFNVSHGGDHALVAWSRLRRVGVDIEPERAAWDWPSLSRVVLGREDAYYIAVAGDEPARAALFLDVWAAKEALLKADGRGIADGLDGFSVLSESSDRPQIDGSTTLAEDLRRFEARWLRGIHGYAACVAWSVDAAQPW